MPRFAAILLFSVLLLVSLAPAAPVPTHLMKPAPYFPTQVGTKWVYSYRWNVLNYTETLAITGVENQYGATIVSIAEVSEDGKESPSEQIAVRDDGLFEVTEPAAEGDPPTFACVLKLPAKRSDSWERIVPTRLGGRYQDATYKETYTIGAEKEMQVMAGTFKAVPVVVVNDLFLSSGIKVTYWYAPHVGLIKKEIDGAEGLNGTCRELVSFTSGQE